MPCGLPSTACRQQSPLSPKNSVKGPCLTLIHHLKSTYPAFFIIITSCHPRALALRGTGSPPTRQTPTRGGSRPSWRSSGANEGWMRRQMTHRGGCRSSSFGLLSGVMRVTGVSSLEMEGLHLESWGGAACRRRDMGPHGNILRELLEIVVEVVEFTEPPVWHSNSAHPNSRPCHVTLAHDDFSVDPPDAFVRTAPGRHVAGRHVAGRRAVARARMVWIPTTMSQAPRRYGKISRSWMKAYGWEGRARPKAHAEPHVDEGLHPGEVGRAGEGGPNPCAGLLCPRSNQQLLYK